MTRRDRWRGGRSRFFKSGGLVTLIHKGWACQEPVNRVGRDNVFEVLSAKVVGQLGAVWRLMNVYIPPESVIGVCEETLNQLRVNWSDGWCVVILTVIYW